MGYEMKKSPPDVKLNEASLRHEEEIIRKRQEAWLKKKGRLQRGRFERLARNVQKVNSGNRANCGFRPLDLAPTAA